MNKSNSGSKMTEDDRIKVIQTAVAGIGKYSDALKELAKTEKNESVD